MYNYDMMVIGPVLLITPTPEFFLGESPIKFLEQLPTLTHDLHGVVIEMDQVAVITEEIASYLLHIDTISRVKIAQLHPDTESNWESLSIGLLLPCFETTVLAIEAFHTPEAEMEVRSPQPAFV